MDPSGREGAQVYEHTEERGQDTPAARVSTPLGLVADRDFGLAAVHVLVGVTTRAQPRHAPLSRSCSKGPQHSR